jgi:hypothetical protein
MTLILINNSFTYLAPVSLKDSQIFMSMKGMFLEILPEARLVLNLWLLLKVNSFISWASGKQPICMASKFDYYDDKILDYSDFLSFFSKTSFTSQHFVFLNFLFSRPFLSTHLWIFSGVFCFLQYSWQCLTKFSVSTSADAFTRENPSVNPIKIAVIFISTPFTINSFDIVTYLHYCVSMYKVNIEPTEIFKALSDPTRLRILRVLVSMPNEEACLCDLTDALSEPEANISRHLKTLRNSGLLMAEKEGRMVYHRLVPTK